MHTSKYAHKKELLHWEKEAMDTQSEYMCRKVVLDGKKKLWVVYL